MSGDKDGIGLRYLKQFDIDESATVSTAVCQCGFRVTARGRGSVLFTQARIKEHDCPLATSKVVAPDPAAPAS